MFSNSYTNSLRNSIMCWHAPGTRPASCKGTQWVYNGGWCGPREAVVEFKAQFVQESSPSCRHGICAQLLDCSPPGFSVHGIFQSGKWSGLPFPTSSDLLNPGIEPTPSASLALAGRSLPLHHMGSPTSYRTWAKLKPPTSPSLHCEAGMVQRLGMNRN